MFVIPLREYMALLQEIEKGEQEENYLQILYCSLEAIPLLISAKEELHKKYGSHATIDYKPVDYACRYLSVLREKEELKGILSVVNHPSLPEDLVDKVNIALDNIDIMNKVIEILKRQDFFTAKQLAEKLLLSEKKISEQLGPSIELKIIKNEGDKLYLVQDIPSLKSIMIKYSAYYQKKSKVNNIINFCKKKLNI